MDTIDLSRPSLLLVEGKRDHHFFFQLAKWIDQNTADTNNRLLNRITFVETGGSDKTLLFDVLDTIRITPGFSQLQSIGIVRDADTNPKGAFQSIQSTLQKAGFAVPDDVLQLSQESNPAVGIIIIPSVEETGYLEHLCLKAFTDDGVLTCIDQYFDCLEDINANPKASAKGKAQFQTLLAAKEPEISPEDAFSKSWFPWEHPAFDDLKQFLTGLAQAT